MPVKSVLQHGSEQPGQRFFHFLDGAASEVVAERIMERQRRIMFEIADKLGGDISAVQERRAFEIERERADIEVAGADHRQLVVDAHKLRVNEAVLIRVDLRAVGD